MGQIPVKLVDQEFSNKFPDMTLEAEAMLHSKALVQGPSKSVSNSLFNLVRAKFRLAI